MRVSAVCGVQSGIEHAVLPLQIHIMWYQTGHADTSGCIYLYSISMYWPCKFMKPVITVAWPSVVALICAQPWLSSTTLFRKPIIQSIFDPSLCILCLYSSPTFAIPFATYLTVFFLPLHPNIPYLCAPLMFRPFSPFPCRGPLLLIPPHCGLAFSRRAASLRLPDMYLHKRGRESS